MKHMTVDVVYIAESVATGGGRDGHVKSADGKIDLDTRPPKRRGAAVKASIPSCCSQRLRCLLLGAVRKVARTDGVSLDENTTVTAQIGFGKHSEGGFGLTATLCGHLPGWPRTTPSSS